MADNQIPHILTLELKKEPTHLQFERHQCVSREDPNLQLRFTPSTIKTPLTAGTTVPLDCTTNESFHQYSISQSFHALVYTDLLIKLPPISPKKELSETLEFCWPHNLAHAIINQARLNFYNTIRQSWTTSSLDAFMNNMLSKDMRKEYSKMIGNIPILEEWKTEIPSMVLSVPQFWFYSMNQGHAIPICLLEKPVILNHIYNFVLDILKLLRVRKYESNNYIEIPIRKEYIHKFESVSKIQTPQMFGRYIIHGTKEEIEFKTKIPRYDYHYMDCITMGAINPISLGKRVTQDLSCNYPSYSVHFMAQNVRAASFNSRSNYSTNPDDLRKGYNPCSSPEIKYGTDGYRVPSSPIEIMDKLSYWHHAKSIPKDPGYNFYSFANEPFQSLRTDSGTVFQSWKATLNVDLIDSDPYQKLENWKKLNDDLPSKIGSSNESNGHIVEISDSESVISSRNSVDAQRKGKEKFLLQTVLFIAKKITLIRIQEGDKVFFRLEDDHEISS